MTTPNPNPYPHPYRSLLNANIHEVLRTLSVEQADEVRLHDLRICKAASNIELSILSQRERRGRALYDTYIPETVSRLAWADLESAEQNGFTGLSPIRAMFLGRMATEVAQSLQVVAPSISCEAFIPLASGVVGLHAAILGSEQLIRKDEPQERLDKVVDALRDNFIYPLYLGRGRS